MLWLIWLLPMVLVPVLAGVRVWWQLRREAAEVPVAIGGQRDDSVSI